MIAGLAFLLPLGEQIGDLEQLDPVGMLYALGAGRAGHSILSSASGPDGFTAQPRFPSARLSPH